MTSGGTGIPGAPKSKRPAAAKWKNGTTAVKMPTVKAPKNLPKQPRPSLGLKPGLASPDALGFAKPKATVPRGTSGSGGGSSSSKSNAWYANKNLSARDAALAAALEDPLAPVTGQDAVTFARSLVQSQSAPAMLEYDRQQGLAESKAKVQGGRQTAGTAALRAAIEAQIAGQQGAQATARNQIGAAGASQAAAVDQGLQAVQAAQQKDAEVRGAGLDGGANAQAASEAAAAKARAASGSQIALDSQAGAGAQNEALLRQISAATAQQGGERQGALTAALNSQLRDINQGRAKTTSDAQSEFVKQLMSLKSENAQTKLSTETLGLNTAKAQSDAQVAQAKLDQDAEIATLNAKIRVSEGAERRRLEARLARLRAGTTLAEGAADRSSREGIASDNRTSAEKRAQIAAEARAERDATKPTTLTAQDKQRRQFIRSAKEFYDGGTLATLKAKVDKQGGGPSQFRQALLRRNVKDTLARQLLTDVAYGGLRPNTIAAYKARYGRNPPSDWKRYKAPAKPSGAAAGLGGTVSGTVG